MQVICPRCGEGWDVASLHENDNELPFTEAARLFRTQGCGAVFDVKCEPPDDEEERERLGQVAVVYLLLGDDIDGAAATLEDFGLL